MKKISILSALVVAMALSACGGGGGGGGDTNPNADAPPTSTGTALSGIAAGGAPLVGTVTVKDSLGNIKVSPIEADGSYNVDVSGMTGPFMLRATGMVGNNSVTYYSAATSADLNKTVNVTPFTSLIISNIAARLAETYYNEGNFSGDITSGSLDVAMSNLQKKLAPVLEALGLSASIDLLRASFATDHTGLDAALDLIKVSIDPATNEATLRNALNNTIIGTDRLNDKTDDATSVTLSDTDKAALAAGLTDLQKVQAVLDKFALLFAGSSLPSMTQLENSGVFETAAGKFIMGGANFQQFASDVSAEEGLLGMKLTGSDIVFSPTDSNTVTAKVRLTLGGGFQEKVEFTLARATADSPWKITGDSRIADISVEPMAVIAPNQASGANSITSGMQMYAEADYHNSNNPGAMVTSAVITGPGIVPASGIQFNAKDGLSYFGIGNTDGNIIPECTSSLSTGCINFGAMTDNAVYTVRLYAGTTVVNGSGYTYTVPKKPEPTAQMTAAMFPSVTTLTIDGMNVTQLSHFQANKNLSVSWAMPAALYADWLTVGFLKGNPPGSAGRENVERDLVGVSGTTTLLALGDGPTGATYAHLWLSGRDLYGREYVLNRRFSN